MRARLGIDSVQAISGGAITRAFSPPLHGAGRLHARTGRVDGIHHNQAVAGAASGVWPQQQRAHASALARCGISSHGCSWTAGLRHADAPSARRRRRLPTAVVASASPDAAGSGGARAADSQAQPTRRAAMAQQQQQQQQQQGPAAAAAAAAGAATPAAELDVRQQRALQQVQRRLQRKQQILTRTQGSQLRQQLMQQQQQRGAPAMSLRTAAAGSTELLLSLLYSQLPQLTGQQQAQQQQPTQQKQQQEVSTEPAGAGAGAAAGAAPQQDSRKVLWRLVDALTTIAWHVKTHELLPAEAGRLRSLLLAHLLPALERQPLAAAPRKALARVVFALGSCHASSWQASGSDGSTESSSSSSSSGASDAAASGAWVVRLLRLLPPQRLSLGALLAAWQGAALHEAPPPPGWLDAASAAAYAALAARQVGHRDTAALLQACVALDYQPPAWLMHELVAVLQQQLALLRPGDLAGVLSGLQALGWRPSNTWLRLWCDASSRLLAGMSGPQLAAAGGGLAWGGYGPPQRWAGRFVAASWPLLPTASADELLLLLHAALCLRLAPPPGWVHESLSHLRARRTSLALRQVADAAHVLTQLGLPLRLVAHHAAWLRACLAARRRDLAGPGSSRSELLYALYAAAALPGPGGSSGGAQGSGGGSGSVPSSSSGSGGGSSTSSSSVPSSSGSSSAWLRRALGRLASLLPGGSPAELVGGWLVLGRLAGPARVSRRQLAAWAARVLGALAGCAAGLSDEGLLAVLAAAAEQQLGPADGSGEAAVAAAAASGEGRQAEQEGGGSDDGDEAAAAAAVAQLAQRLAARLPSMPLTQLSRLVKGLEAGGGGSGGRRPAWYAALLADAKAALASRA